MEKKAIIKHSDIAERLRHLLEARGLTRDAFLASIQHAVSPSTLFSLLNGHRRPSGSLASLIEQVHGFRARYLLNGEAPMWVAVEERAVAGGWTLSTEEQEVIRFMRTSHHHARELRQNLQQARLWTDLYARIEEVLAELAGLAHSADEGMRRRYPLMSRLALEECQWHAGQYDAYIRAVHARRVQWLTTRFIERFLREMPRELLPAAEFATVEAMLAPLLVQREREAAVLADNAANLEANLAALARLGLPDAHVESALRHRPPGRLAQELAGLQQAVARAAPALREALDRCLALAGPHWPGLPEVVKELLPHLSLSGVSPVPARSLEELEADYRERIGLALRGVE